MDKKISRKIICSILLKDSKNKYHRLFQVEGDKHSDPSLYIVKLNHVNKDVIFDENRYRRFCLQKTIHSKIGHDGLVQSHMKRGDNRFGLKRCCPINKLNYVSHYSLSQNDDVEKYPIKIPGDDDIVITSKSQYISDYSFVFYKGEDSLSKYISSHGLFILHKYSIPTINTKGHMIAIAIKLSRLIEIQASKEDSKI